MLKNSPEESTTRSGATDFKLIVLLSAILSAVVILIFVLLLKPSGPTRGRGGATIPPGQTVGREGLLEQGTIDPVGSREQVIEVLQPGKKYKVTVKAGFDARVEDRAYAISAVTNLGYLAEFQITRKIESNDGFRIVEVRTFDNARSVKVLAEVEALSIDLGMAGETVLGFLAETVAPGQGIVAIAMARPIAEAFLKDASQSLVQDNAAKTFAYVDSLSGKSVRVAYLNDGSGVESVTPIDCSLSPEELDFIGSSAVLSDAYLFPKVQVGESYSVPGSQFSSFMDPSWRGIPSGEVLVKRISDEKRGGKDFANLTIAKGLLEINGSDSATRRVGSFAPRGTLLYNITDGYTQSANLDGEFRIDEVSQDHLLFETSFRTQPKMQIVYSCTMSP